MLHASCFMLHASCFMLHASCFMLHASWFMLMVMIMLRPSCFMRMLMLMLISCSHESLIMLDVLCSWFVFFALCLCVNYEYVMRKSIFGEDFRRLFQPKFHEILHGASAPYPPKTIRRGGLASTSSITWLRKARLRSASPTNSHNRTLRGGFAPRSQLNTYVFQQTHADEFMMHDEWWLIFTIDDGWWMMDHGWWMMDESLMMDDGWWMID